MSTPQISDIDIVIFHADCSDGFGAAWAVYSKFGPDRVEYIPGTHANKKGAEEFWLEKVKGKNVVCYDFSFSRQLTEKIHAAAGSFQVIDHHISAQMELDDLDYCYFDMDKSGAVLAWESISPEIMTPTLLAYVQDRDLWRWALPHSKAIWNYISSCERSFLEWDRIDHEFRSTGGTKNMADAGAAMEAKVANISKDIADDMEMWIVAGHSVPVSNCPRALRSDVCEDLGNAGKFPFVGCYQVEEGTATWSLRSNHGTEDVSAIASGFPGGGGHKEAAGFTISVDRMDFINREIK